ncbi:ATP-binding protein [Streptomyces sp. NPDC058045]|uniref:ATP-binding protein n=1 Tax=Streptomyces sp. NPDC058045 TaxID=3346311 RepID=UPI0036EDA213
MDPNDPNGADFPHRHGGHPDPAPQDARYLPVRHSPPARAPLDPTPAANPPQVRTVTLHTGDFLLTVNPLDGSEIEPCPPGERAPQPVRRTPAERAERARAALPPVPPAPTAPRVPLLARDEARHRLARLLARGRSVRLTGPAGCGRTALLDAVAGDCAGLAPDGVIRLTGHRRTTADLLYDLYAEVFDAGPARPDETALLASVQGIGAVVVLDDLEFGGAALDELLDATPECAFLLAATPEVAAPSPGSHLEEVHLPGLDRGASLALLAAGTGRALSPEESAWAGELWPEWDGLPVRVLQAAALLRRRDRIRAGEPLDQSPWRPESALGEGRLTPVTAFGAATVPLPTFGEGAAPVPVLAARLGHAARAALRFALALDGELPHPAHLPALVGDTHADTALTELLDAALVTPVGSRHRLAAGAAAQLEAVGQDGDRAAHLRAAAAHYAWWTGHPSVTPERVAAEAEAVLAALAGAVPTAGSTAPAPGPASGTEDGPRRSLPVRLARGAAPAFAAALDWGSWERALRAGQEAARHAGEIADQAYFHHELGVLALCRGSLDRARAELEASIGLRGALADRRGTVAGRRALALVADRSGHTVTGPLPGEPPIAARHDDDPSSTPATGVPVPVIVPGPPSRPEPAAVSGFEPVPAEQEALVTHRMSAAAEPEAVGHGHRKAGVVRGTRRNLAAAGAGAVLVAVLGTVITLGITSRGDQDSSGTVGSTPSASQDDSGDTAAEEPTTAPATTASSPEPEDSVTPTTSAPTPTPDPVTQEPSRSAPASPTRHPSPTPTPTRSSPKPTPTKSSPKPTPSGSETGKPTPTESPTTEPTGPDGTSDSASRTAASTRAEGSPAASGDTTSSPEAGPEASPSGSL